MFITSVVFTTQNTYHRSIREDDYQFFARFCV